MLFRSPYHWGMLRRHLTRTALASVVATLALVALAGCAQTSTKAVTSYHGDPKGVEVPAGATGDSPFSVWLKGGDQFSVTLYGSSTCPPVATKIDVTSHNHVTLTVPSPTAKGKVCTMDFVPHTTVFTTPGAIDRKTNVSITGQGSTWVLKALASS